MTDEPAERIQALREALGFQERSKARLVRCADQLHRAMGREVLR